MKRRAGIMSVLTLCCLAMGGCASSPRVAWDGSSPMAGVMLEMLVRRDASQAVFYRVQPDGALGWGGGQAALARETTWQGTLTDEEATALLALLDRHQWRSGGATASGEPPTLVHEIRLDSPEGSQRYRLVGDEAGLREIRGLLENASRRRLDSFIETLPKAGDRP